MPRSSALFLAPPHCESLGAERQYAQRRASLGGRSQSSRSRFFMIGGLSSDDRPVRVGFISIAGQKREDFVVAAVAAHAQPSPSIVSLLIYDESQTKIAISDIVPVAEAPLRRVGRDHHLVAHGEERRSRPHANSRRKSVRPVVILLCLHCIFTSSGDHEQESLRTSFKSVGVILQDEI